MQNSRWSDRILANALSQPYQQGLLIAIATDKGLAQRSTELTPKSERFPTPDTCGAKPSRSTGSSVGDW
ncbi:hypothetical protein HW132_06770 [Brasilonema sp. CT11]|nr:hypothetical protein [Brasilonema sp. CT11]